MPPPSLLQAPRIAESAGRTPFSRLISAWSSSWTSSSASAASSWRSPKAPGRHRRSLPKARIHRVTTKYPNITLAHYAQTGVQVEVVKLHGNIELAPLTGMSASSTSPPPAPRCARNNLRIVEEVLSSTARFFANACSLRTDDRIIALSRPSPTRRGIKATSRSRGFIASGLTSWRLRAPAQLESDPSDPDGEGAQHASRQAQPETNRSHPRSSTAREAFNAGLSAPRPPSSRRFASAGTMPCATSPKSSTACASTV